MDFLLDAKKNHPLFLKLLSPFLHPLVPTERIFLAYLAGALILALWIYHKQLAGRTFRAAEFLRFCFPREIYSRKSAVLDFIYYFIYRAFFLICIVPLLLTTHGAAVFFTNIFHHFFPAPPSLAAPPALLSIIFTLSSIIVLDFAIFITHVFQHKISWLWEFHKVHHSAQVMTPITVYRVHPADDILTLSAGGLLTGLNLALFSFFFPGRFSEIMVLGLNVFLFAFYFFGFNLRHSHVWLNYPRSVSRFLISPAQHQIHHSKAAAHRDKNFGFLFAFWDLWSDSLVIPSGQMNVEFGLSHGEEEEYSSVARLFFLPFVKIKNRIKKPKMIS